MATVGVDNLSAYSWLDWSGSWWPLGTEYAFITWTEWTVTMAVSMIAL